MVGAFRNAGRRAERAGRALVLRAGRRQRRSASASASALVGLVGRDMAQRRGGEQARFALALRSSEEQGAVAVEAAELGTLRWDTANGNE